MKSFLANAWRLLGFRGTLVLALLLLFLIVGFQNMEPVDVDFLFWDLLELSKLVFMLGVFVFGVVVGVLLAWRGRRAEY